MKRPPEEGVIWMALWERVIVSWRVRLDLVQVPYKVKIEMLGGAMMRSTHCVISRGPLVDRRGNAAK